MNSVIEELFIMSGYDAGAAEGKIKEGPLDIITIGFVAKFYHILICITFL